MTKFRLKAVVFVIAYLNLLGGADAKSLVLGRVSSDPLKVYKQLTPMVDYVASRMTDLGITDGTVLVAKDHRSMLDLLREKKVDWVQKGVFEAVSYKREAGAELALRSWRQGVPSYTAVIFSRKDGPVNSIADLVGKKLAFEDPGSTSAFFVPSAILMRAGYQLRELGSPRDKTPMGVIGYAFAGDELSISTWVHRGLADAGAYHNQNWDNPGDNPESMKKDFRIIYQGKPMPRMIESFRGDLDPKLKHRIKEILLRAHEDPAAKQALQSYGPDTKRFDEFVGEAKKELDEAIELESFFNRRR
ncbi:MAG: phosphate/phosphite/phosphonate ABC transporter substrate-binding protein [Deltaproteobacteria bacterium]|nr:phosphate/phosphite/phosphonate ABC transporter substrate-binding protein [Deltaproteobacteria bacterium]